MKQAIGLMVMALSVCVLALAGCEWSGGSSATTWNEAGNWVDFSGTYKAPDNGILVRAYGVSTNAATNAVSTNTVSSEYLATGNGTDTAFHGQLRERPVRGSLTIFTVGGYRFTDSASGSDDTVTLAVTPDDGSVGTFNYSTHAWALNFPAPIANGTIISATYQYSLSEDLPNPIQGNHGKPIYSFVVMQTGNNLILTDSNGTRYEGTIGTVRTTGGEPIDLREANTIPPSTGPVVAQFSATGISQGFKVSLVGVLQGTLAGAQNLTGRVLQGTFVEEGGFQADVSARAQ